MNPAAIPPFSVDEIPFSRRGAWFDLSPVTGLHERRDDIHLVSHQTGMHAVLAVVPLDRAGARADVHRTADPSTLILLNDEGSVEAVFDTISSVRLRGAGLGLRLADPVEELTPFSGSFFFVDPVDGAAVFTSYETGRRYRVTLLHGDWAVDGAEAYGSADRAITVTGASWEVRVEEVETGVPAPAPDSSFDDAREEVAREFSDYLDAVVPWRTDATPAAALAAYVLWSATVAPAGFLTRESIFMSKHWMDKVWSWDHCFNALALAPGLPDHAIDQFLAPFDHQDATGAPPDSLTHSEKLYNFVKPPMHGWALGKLRARLGRPMREDELREVFDRLSRWADFWLEQRRAPAHPLPYYQHGNDSGWDNSTMFDADRVVDAPDLAAFLAILLDRLAELAEELGGDGGTRRDQAAALRAALTGSLLTDDGFIARGTLNDRPSSTTSLLTLLPIVDGAHLDTATRELLASRIEAILTEWGPATEPVASPHYESDGYWRGPIWAPSTVIVEDGLRASGFPDLADTVSARFRRLCERSGFAENFDAITGEGLRDLAYTWTASAYLLLAHEAVLRGDA